MCMRQIHPLKPDMCESSCSFEYLYINGPVKMFAKLFDCCKFVFGHKNHAAADVNAKGSYIETLKHHLSVLTPLNQFRFKHLLFIASAQKGA